MVSLFINDPFREGIAMKPIEQKTAAKQFAAYWATRGDEKQDTQSFWLSLFANRLWRGEPRPVYPVRGSRQARPRQLH